MVGLKGRVPELFSPPFLDSDKLHRNRFLVPTQQRLELHERVAVSLSLRLFTPVQDGTGQDRTDRWQYNWIFDQCGGVFQHARNKSKNYKIRILNIS